MAGGWENQKDVKRGGVPAENARAPSEKPKVSKRVFEKLQVQSFDSSTSTEPKTPIKEDPKIEEERLSPAQETISMFEGLANAYIMTEKPFTENETSANNDSKPESQGEMLNGSPTANEAECLDSESQATNVTLDELREKIKEILSIPLPEDSQEELKEDEINIRHETNMRMLQQKLRLDVSEENQEPGGEQRPATDDRDMLQSKNAAESVVRTSVPFRKNKAPSVPKYNLEEARKIFTRGSPRNAEKKKSMLDHKVTDLTQETLQISKQTPKLLRAEAFKENNVPAFEDNEAYKLYYKEREIVELAKKPKDETTNEEIQVEYAETNTSKERRSFIQSLLRIISCGRI